jgi:ubiquinone/menaquinone biosynthesis C-methylase UbiE
MNNTKFDLSKNKLENYIKCFECKGTIIKSSDQNYLCNFCKKEFVNYNSIADLRDIKMDNTRGFNIKKDLEIGKILLKIYDKVKTYNALIYILDKLEKYENPKFITDDKIEEIIISSLTFETPMSSDQSIHGYDILKKIDLYKEEFHYDDYPKNTCLENGGGIGLFTEGFSKNFKNVIVIDFSIAYLVVTKKLCEEKNLSNVFLVCANVENLPLKDKSVDFIHSNNVIEHVTHQNKMISEISRILSNEGLLFLLSPNKNSAYYEPHFNIPFYGWVPFKIRYWLIYKLQNRDCRDVSLLNFKELKNIFNKNFYGKSEITFLPSNLKKTAQQGYLRKIIIYFLNNKFLGSFFSYIINRTLIAIMPYHVIIARKNKPVNTE